MMEKSELDLRFNTILQHEPNWLTKDVEVVGNNAIQAIKAEFDFIQLCQGMIRPFGLQAKNILDHFIALSLRKLLCDDSIVKQICPEFKMPPLSGFIFDCPGDNGELKLVEINPDLHIKPRNEWILLNDWLQSRIAWIEKSVEDIPDAYGDVFYNRIKEQLPNEGFEEFFRPEVDVNGNRIWVFVNPSEDKKRVYEILKNKGYYDLTIKSMIKHIADKQSAHIDKSHSLWVILANSGTRTEYSAISTFALQMIYAATKQINGLKDYFAVDLMMEVL